jgi:hypothetical protein
MGFVKGELAIRRWLVAGGNRAWNAIAEDDGSGAT